MFQLLSPAGLWALAALALPLAIHLWRPPPRTVRLGSLRFLENLPRRLRDLRWRERALLAARLALLTLLALLLARPLWQRRPPPGPQHWVLLDPAARLDPNASGRLRARRADGYETRVLAPGFPVAPAVSPDPAPRAGDTAPDLWSLLREADAGLPAGSSLAVFSPGRLASLRGMRPALAHCRVEWVRTPDAPVPPRPNAPPGRPPTVLILHDPVRAGEADALAAAVHATAMAAGWDHPDVRIGPTFPTEGNSPEADWIFWLDSRPVPAAWAGRGVQIVSEEPGTESLPAGPSAGWIVPVPGGSGAAEFLAPARLWRRVTPPTPAPGAADWTDGFGRPLLTVERTGAATRWRFYSRFDPAWNDLPDGLLAVWMSALLRGGGQPWPPRPPGDPRLADPAQCRPADAAPTSPAVTLPPVGENPVDLRGPLWAVAALLFGLERAWSHHRRPTAAAMPEPAATAVPTR